MRQIVLDTETTGLDPTKGHRIIEIGCIELVERRRTGRRFHRYLNPQRAIDHGALEVHGITLEFLQDKPTFGEIADELIEFLRDGELVIHNAAFDLAFLDAELALLAPSHGRVADHARVLDTLALARERYPGQKNSLDALCRRFDVDARHRELHGALLDASLLTDVYLAMTAGQGDLAFVMEGAEQASRRTAADVPRRERRLRLAFAAPEELAAHAARLATIDSASKGNCMWRHLEEAVAA
ncbi:MAG TPA: DNA polymerase III subunit epsilon [Xanthomonadales bacterium]|nr:DNA polymerase III subunit epsilon [Xanthomonadales bacterium]